MQKNLFLQILIILGGFSLILLLAGANYLNGYLAVQSGEKHLLEQRISQHSLQIKDLELITDVLVSENKNVALKLEEERAKRLVAETENKTAVNRLTELEQSVENSKTNMPSEVISSWRPRVASVKCQWNFDNGVQASASGSAVLVPNVSTTAIVGLITSKHVVNYKGYSPSACSVRFPGESSSYTITATNISFSEEFDSAIINIPSPSVNLITLNLENIGRCSADGVVGDEIVILGYPGIGSRDDITATEGIISGYESGYYLSSAKVERGNSGGAAVSIRNNCYLGIPTFVDVGEIESLARILDQKLIK